MYAHLLARLEAAILRRNPGMASGFQPGLPPDEIRAQLKRAGVKGNVDPIVEFYAWHNGSHFPKENDADRLGFAPPMVETVQLDQKTIEFMEGLGYKVDRGSKVVQHVFKFLWFDAVLNDLRMSKKFRSSPRYGILHARVLPFLSYTKTAQHLAFDADPSSNGRLLSIQPTNMKGEPRVREAYASFEEFLLDAIRANENNAPLTWPKTPGDPVELPVPELPAARTAKSKKPAIPATKKVLALRTDFSDGGAWDALCAAVAGMDGDSGAALELVSDPLFSGLAAKELPNRLAETYEHPIVVLIDQMTLAHSDRPLLVVDLQDKPGRSFRATLAALADIYDNLSTANMEFSEFANAVDADGIFREFKESG